MQVRSLLATTAATAVVGLLPISAQATTLFGTSGIYFDQNTTIRFTLDGFSQYYRSNLAIYLVTDGKVDTSSAVNLFQEFPTTGSPSPIGSFQDFNFVAGKTYTLGLSNFNPSNGTPGLSPIVYSTSTFNTARYLDPVNSSTGPHQQAVFGSTGSPVEGTPFNPTGNTSGATTLDAGGPVQISFEDGGWDGTLDINGNPVYVLNNGVPAKNDRDFNDFRITAIKVIPTPPLLLGLLALGSRVFFRQRKALRA